MKQIVFGVTAGMMIILLIGIMITVHGRTLRTNEAEKSLESAMRMAMEQVDGTGYTFADREEFVADFLGALLIQMSSDSDITVRILHADEKRGLLSVEVVECYRHPNGGHGSVSVRRTILLDRREEGVGL